MTRNYFEDLRNYEKNLKILRTMKDIYGGNLEDGEALSVAIGLVNEKILELKGKMIEMGIVK